MAKKKKNLAPVISVLNMKGLLEKQLFLATFLEKFIEQKK